MTLTEEQLSLLPKDAVEVTIVVNEHLKPVIESGKVYAWNKTTKTWRSVSTVSITGGTQTIYVGGTKFILAYTVTDNTKYVVYNTESQDNTFRKTCVIEKGKKYGSEFEAREINDGQFLLASVLVNEGCKNVKYSYTDEKGVDHTITTPSSVKDIKVSKNSKIEYEYTLKDDWEYLNGNLKGSKTITSANKEDNVIGISPTKKGVPTDASNNDNNEKVYVGTQVYVPFVDGKKIKTTAKYYIYNAKNIPQAINAEVSAGTDKEGYKTLAGSIIGSKGVVVSYEDIPSGYVADKNPLEVTITKDNQQVGSKDEPNFSKQTVKPGENSGGNNTPGSTGGTSETPSNPSTNIPTETTKNPEQPVLKPNGTKYELVVKGSTNQQYKIEVVYNDDLKQTHTYNYTKLEDRIKDLPYGSTYAISFKADDGYIPTEAINGTVKDNVELGPFEAKKKTETTPPSSGDNGSGSDKPENGSGNDNDSGSSGSNNNGTEDSGENNKKSENVYEIYYKKYENGFKDVYTIYYLKLLNGLAEIGKNKKKLEGDSEWTYSSGDTNNNTDINIGSMTKEIRELRKTPGFTTYVADVQKDVYGNVLDSATLKRYYSNIDAEIYINGVWLEDISSIQWTVDQQTMPLYGYNSYIFDDIAQGARIIQGMFTVAFTVPRKVEKFIRDYSEITDATKIDGTKLTYENLIKELSTKEVKLNRNGSVLTSNKPHKPIWMNNKFDIDIVCGEYEAIGGNAVHIILKECWITRVGSMRVKDGGVAEEVYSFLARDYKTIT